MIKVDSKGTAALFDVRVAPGASRTRIVGEYSGALKVAVSAAPEKGKANKALLAALAKALGAKKADITLVSGETSRTKRVAVEGQTSAQLERKLAEICK
ncbi:MAG: DUF167 domain-containing protein [Planctomycetes bacterium]|nr:DUF167 domain-containing protein [Planctomycetota bacterium]